MLAFGALLLHQAVDGLQVGASGVIEHGMTVVLAVAAHSTPLIAVTVLAGCPRSPGYAPRSRGVLLYILGHDLAEDRPDSVGVLWAEWIATVLGMGIPLVWLDVTSHHHDTVHPITGLVSGSILAAAFTV